MNLKELKLAIFICKIIYMHQKLSDEICHTYYEILRFRNPRINIINLILNIDLMQAL